MHLQHGQDESPCCVNVLEAAEQAYEVGMTFCVNPVSSNRGCSSSKSYTTIDAISDLWLDIFFKISPFGIDTGESISYTSNFTSISNHQHLPRYKRLITGFASIKAKRTFFIKIAGHV
jgi:hypothetical protein